MSRRRWVQLHDLVEPVAGKGRKQWIVGRGLCRYRWFDLTDLPAGRREDALRLRVRQWSPYAETAEYTVWSGGGAQVWCWDAAKIEAARAEHDAARFACVPEPLLRAPLAEGLRILACQQGVEGQWWADNTLRASRWWRESPSLAEWQRFARAQGQAAPGETPEAEALPWLATPWGKPRSQAAAMLRQEKYWVAAALAGLMAAAGWEGAMMFRQQQALAQVEAESEALQRDSAAILTARNQAVADQTRANTLLTLSPYPSLLETMTASATVLPNPEARFKHWRYVAGALQVTLEAPDIDAREYVSAFQGHELFREVKLETDSANVGISLRMEVRERNSSDASGKP